MPEQKKPQKGTRRSTGPRGKSAETRPTRPHSKRPTTRTTRSASQAKREKEEAVSAVPVVVETAEEPVISEPPEYVVIAQIVSPFGLRGAVKANIQTDFPDRFEQLQEVFLSVPGSEAAPDWQPRPLMSARLQNEKQVVLRFAGITKVEQAELLRGYSVAVPVAEVVPLPEGEYYIFQIIGLEVYTTAEQYVGRVVNVESLPANDIYCVRGPLSPKDVLIPAIKDVIKQIDLEAGRITIELMDGLIS